jgi:putative transposase
MGADNEDEAIYDEQPIAILGEAEVGAKTKDLCRKYGISEPTSYNWKAKYGGMTISDARRLKDLETENSRLKKLRRSPN